jgi:hypothetical protein
MIDNIYTIGGHGRDVRKNGMMLQVVEVLTLLEERDILLELCKDLASEFAHMGFVSIATAMEIEQAISDMRS